ncbi:MAG TPA: hypothetical protein DCR14_19885 [Acidimicrobiaceae bacterium]|nr:hypothetical protein [Acidimicrobiaceae bacterium]
MARLCERPGCSQPADVTYGIDADHLTVWIEPFDGAVVYRAGVLCRRHADAMVVPLGWMLDDRREVVPRLFKPREAPPPVRAKPRRSRHHSQRDETGQLELPTATDDAAPPTAHEAPPAALGGSDGAANPWKPVFDQNDDLGGLLKARSPLLSRAFKGRDRDTPG